jgi:hypothetical protein
LVISLGNLTPLAPLPYKGMGVSKPLSLWGRGMEAGLFGKLYDFSNIF